MLIDKRWHDAASAVTMWYSNGSFAMLRRLEAAVRREPELASRIGWLLFGGIGYDDVMGERDRAAWRHLLASLPALRYVELKLNASDLRGDRSDVAGMLGRVRTLRHVALSSLYDPHTTEMPEPASTIAILHIALASSASFLRTLRLDGFVLGPGAKGPVAWAAAIALPSLRELHVSGFKDGGQLALPALVASAPRVELLCLDLGRLDGRNDGMVEWLVPALAEAVPPTVRAVGLGSTVRDPVLAAGLLDPIVARARPGLRVLLIDNPPVVTPQAISHHRQLRHLQLSHFYDDGAAAWHGQLQATWPLLTELKHVILPPPLDEQGVPMTFNPMLVRARRPLA